MNRSLIPPQGAIFVKRQTLRERKSYNRSSRQGRLGQYGNDEVGLLISLNM